MMLVRLAMGFVAAAIALSLSACRSEEEDLCEEYCDAEQECSEMNHVPFSTTECLFYCTVEQERKSSQRCDREWEDFLDCKIELSCSSWGNDGEECAREIDWLGDCIGSGT